MCIRDSLYSSFRMLILWVFVCLYIYSCSRVSRVRYFVCACRISMLMFMFVYVWSVSMRWFFPASNFFLSQLFCHFIVPSIIKTLTIKHHPHQPTSTSRFNKRLLSPEISHSFSDASIVPPSASLLRFHPKRWPKNINSGTSSWFFFFSTSGTVSYTHLCYKFSVQAVNSY